jgi:hypothetical protein
MAKRIFFFTEGESEGTLLVALFRKCFLGKFSVIKSLVDFVSHTDPNCLGVFILDCGGIQRIGPEIENRAHIFDDEMEIVTLGDVEDLGCFTSRKADIHEDVTLIPNSRIKHVLSKPDIENVYWEHPADLVRCVKKIYRDKFKKQMAADIDLSEYSKTQGGLKLLFKNHGLKYNKPTFAEYFFNSFEFEHSTHLSIQRLIGILSGF